MWRLTCLLGRLRSAASVQQVICRSGSTCRCIFDAFVGRKFSSVIQSCPALWDTMDCSTPSFPVHHQLPEFIQTHVLWVGDVPPPRIMGIKTKINKCNLIKRKSFCTAKETINKVKRQLSEWEKIITNKTTDKGLISKIHKHLIQLITRKINNPVKKLSKRPK